MKDSKSSGTPEGKSGAAESPRPIALSAAREKAIDLLSECFAQDLLTLDDFERRVTLAHGARTMTELGSALSGLRTGARTAGAGKDGGLATLPRLSPDVPPARVRRADRAIAVFGETKRAGAWVPARRNTAVAVMGSVEIDLREALLGPGESSFTAVTVMGSVEIIVPPGLQVECAGSALFGAFEHGEPSLGLTTADAPVVRIDGFAIFGSVEVEVRHAGESKRQARRRRRLAKRKRRREIRERRQRRLR